MGCSAQTTHHKVYHFADGRSAYHDDNMAWWFLVNSGTSTDATMPTTSINSGSWARGTAPTEGELDDAETTTEVFENPGEAAHEAGEQVDSDGGNDSGDSTSADGGGDSGGGDSGGE